MTTVFDVPADMLIQRAAEKLKSYEECAPPDWAMYVKTGVHKERPPVQEDWWYHRLAAILRKVYMYGPIGTERLAAHFGGKVDRGSKPYRARKGSRSVIRRALIALEEIGMVERHGKKGRKISPKGQSFLDNTAHEVAMSISLSRGEMEAEAT